MKSKEVLISGSLSYRDLGTNNRKLYNAIVNGVCIIKRPDQRVIRFTDHETFFFLTKHSITEQTRTKHNKTMQREVKERYGHLFLLLVPVDNSYKGQCIACTKKLSVPNCIYIYIDVDR